MWLKSSPFTLIKLSFSRIFCLQMGVFSEKIATSLLFYLFLTMLCLLLTECKIMIKVSLETSIFFLLFVFVCFTLFLFCFEERRGSCICPSNKKQVKGNNNVDKKTFWMHLWHKSSYNNLGPWCFNSIIKQLLKVVCPEKVVITEFNY